MSKNKHPIKIQQGGYSDVRLWPCYMLSSSLVLFLMPRMGLLLSIALVYVPLFFIAIRVATGKLKDDKRHAKNLMARTINQFRIRKWIESQTSNNAQTGVVYNLFSRKAESKHSF